MKRTLLGNMVLVAALTGLSGCLAINAALGVIGLVGPPAMQLAGAAYTVSEYSYEYAANNRTPDMVLMAKFDWLIQTEEDPSMEGYARAFREVALAPQVPDTMVAQAAPGAAPFDRPDLTALAQMRPATPARTLLRRVTRPVAKKSGETLPTVAAATARAMPVHTYVNRPVDPLLARLDKVESALHQAEAMHLVDPESGVRLSMPCAEDNPYEQGINGAWSIRHPLMNTVPTPVHSTASSLRSLNT